MKREFSNWGYLFKVIVKDKNETEEETIENLRIIKRRDISDQLNNLTPINGTYVYYSNDLEEDFIYYIGLLMSSYLGKKDKKYKINKKNIIRVPEGIAYVVQGREYEEMLRNLEKRTRYRLIAAKKLLKDIKLDSIHFWTLIHVLYPMNDYLFYIPDVKSYVPGVFVVNDVELYNRMKEGDKLYILESYTYLFVGGIKVVDTNKTEKTT